MPSTPRLLFFARELSIGGAERQLVLLARGLASAGWEVSVLTMYSGGALEGDLGDKVTLLNMGKRGRWDLASLPRGISSTVRRQHPDLLHSYLDAPNAIAALCRIARITPPVVWGVRASDMDWRGYDMARRLSFEATRVLSRVPALIIANSQAGRRFAIAKGYPSERIEVIPNAIDVERFRPDAAARTRLRAEWEIPDSVPVLGLLGRLDPMKGHETFLRAADRIAAESDARFVIAGNGDRAYAAQLRASPAAQRIGSRVRWLPSQRDVPALLNALDVLVLPSHWGEGFPNVLGEALACGVPCVATDSGDSAIVVAEHGEIVPRGDAVALAEACLRAVRLTAVERMQRGAAARASVVERFAPERLVRDTANALIRAMQIR